MSKLAAHVEQTAGVLLQVQGGEGVAQGMDREVRGEPGHREHLLERLPHLMGGDRRLVDRAEDRSNTQRPPPPTHQRAGAATAANRDRTRWLPCPTSAPGCSRFLRPGASVRAELTWRDAHC